MTDQVITIDNIYPAKEGNNPNFRTLQLRTEVSSGVNNFLSQFLGEGFTQKRVAFQSMHKDIVAELGVAVGDNINEFLKEKAALVVTELTNDEYIALSEDEQLGYQKKLHGETKEVLTKNGLPIWRRTDVMPAGTEDKLVKADTAKEEAKAEVSSAGKEVKA